MYIVTKEDKFTVITPSIEVSFIIRYKLRTFLYNHYIIGGYTYVYCGE